jgi:carbamoyl-phosphate synthase large subunit
MHTSILISSVGRRSQLIGCVRQSIRALNLTGSVLGVDCSRSAPGAYLVDQFFEVPRCDNPEFLPRLLTVCKQNGVTLLIPTIDTELALYAAHRKDFAEIGTTVAVSSPETIEICADKDATHRWLIEKGLPTVRQTTPESVLHNGKGWTFPLVVKPRRGSASIGCAKVPSWDALRSLSMERTDLLVQELALGHEHTVNVLVDQRGKCLCAVPHVGLEVRDGEVSKGTTVKHRGLMDLTTHIAELLPGAYGPLNIQCFLGPAGTLQVTEINARFGGGYPLAHRAGADFPKWMLEELLQIPSSASANHWEDGLTMLRYDDAVFLPRRNVKAVDHDRA